MPHWVPPSSFEQSYDPRHLTGDRTNHNLCGTTPSLLNVNAQVPEPSTFSPTYTYPQSPSYSPPFASFSEQSIVGNTYSHNYSATQESLFVQPQALTAAYPIPSPNYDNTSSTPLMAADHENSSKYIYMSTPTHSPIEHFDHVNMSSFDLPYVLTPSLAH
jgi:hypothetical protein